MVEQPMVVVTEQAVQWFRREIDLGELARLRWEKGFGLRQLAAHFGMPKTSVLRRLKNLEQERTKS